MSYSKRQQKISNAEYYRNNKDLIKSYRDQNKEVINYNKRLYYLKNKDKISAKHKEWADKNKKTLKEKNLEYYHSEMSTEKGRERIRENRRRAYNANSKKCIGYGVESRCRRRLRLKGINVEDSAYSHYVILSLKIDARCSYCGDWLIVKGPSVDHILPVAKGGTNKADNLCICCKPCNSSKGTKTIEEWRKLHKSLI